MESLSSSDREKIMIVMGITARDIAVLKYLVENRFCTSSVLLNKFWNGKKTNSHFRRMRKLQIRGFVEPILGDGDCRLGYRAKPPAVNLLTFFGISLAAPEALDVIYKSSYNHDRLLVELRNIFESSPIVMNFKAEHIVRSEMQKAYGHAESEGASYKVPDGCFNLQTSKRIFRVALELEIAVKTKDRYRKALRQLSISPDWDLVLFVIEDENRIALLNALLDELRMNDFTFKSSKRVNAIYFVSLDEFLKQRLNAVIIGEKKRFTLSELASEIEHRVSTGVDTLNAKAAHQKMTASH